MLKASFLWVQQMDAFKAMTRYEQIQLELLQAPKNWLVTGVAGFIGSNVLETLLKLNQRVVGLDNFATGHQRNLTEVQNLVTEAQWKNFNFIHGDIRNFEDCQKACDGVDFVLHQAALGSVPRSLADPVSTNDTNISGFLNMLVAARDANIKSFTYAASSSTYGDHPSLPKVEENIGKPLSPYAVTKYVNELYADVFARCYGFNTIGLRYFNVFGPRQDPNGAYAAVIPKWIASMIKGEPVYINGDGETSRDFCFIANVVQANLLAANASGDAISSEAQYSMPPVSPLNQVYNVALGDRTTLNELFHILRDTLQATFIASKVRKSITPSPTYRDFRPGDVRHSLADINKAQCLLGYAPTQRTGQGLELAMPWYVDQKYTAF